MRFSFHLITSWEYYPHHIFSYFTPYIFLWHLFQNSSRIRHLLRWLLLNVLSYPTIVCHPSIVLIYWRSEVHLRTLICIMSFVATFVTSDKAKILSTILFWAIYSIMSRLAIVETNILSMILLLPPIDYLTLFLTPFAFDTFLLLWLLQG
jgi:hypothetical protein